MLSNPDLTHSKNSLNFSGPRVAIHDWMSESRMALAVRFLGLAARARDARGNIAVGAAIRSFSNNSLVPGGQADEIRLEVRGGVGKQLVVRGAQNLCRASRSSQPPLCTAVLRATRRRFQHSQQPESPPLGHARTGGREGVSLGYRSRVRSTNG